LYSNQTLRLVRLDSNSFIIFLFFLHLLVFYSFNVRKMTIFIWLTNKGFIYK
jgi:hypothetical protein